MENNIEQFNEYTAIFLIELYSGFPEPKSMKPYELVGGVIDEEELTACAKTEFSAHTFRWLEKEGFLTTEGSMGGNSYAFRSCVLTSKGLAALNAEVDCMKENRSVIDLLRTGLKMGAAESAKAIISQSIAKMFALTNSFNYPGAVPC